MVSPVCDLERSTQENLPRPTVLVSLLIIPAELRVVRKVLKDVVEALPFGTAQGGHKTKCFRRKQKAKFR